jgi:DNA-binding beta-propeller fold protein YncE
MRQGKGYTSFSMSVALDAIAHACVALEAGHVGRQEITHGCLLCCLASQGGSKGVNNVYSYNMSTGALLSKAVLRGDPSGSEYRSALLFNAGPGMLINVAWKEDSYLALYGACDASSGVRTFSSRFAATHLAHGYGLAAGADAATNQPSVWVSNQNTANVVQFDVQGRFLKALPAFPTGEELRGLAFNPVTGVLYVADKTQNAVKAFNTKTAAWSQFVHHWKTR